MTTYFFSTCLETHTLKCMQRTEAQQVKSVWLNCCCFSSVNFRYVPALPTKVHISTLFISHYLALALPVYFERSRQLGQAEHVSWLQSLLCQILQLLLLLATLPWQHGQPVCQSCGSPESHTYELRHVRERPPPHPRRPLTVVLPKHLGVEQVRHRVELHVQHQEDVWQRDAAPGLASDFRARSLPLRRPQHTLHAFRGDAEKELKWCAFFSYGHFLF